jgi:hypothetical protein
MQFQQPRVMIYHAQIHFQVERSDLSRWALRNVEIEWWGLGGCGRFRPRVGPESAGGRTDNREVIVNDRT